MISSEIAPHLEFKNNGSKIILFVIDGVGGLPLPKTGLTELETAHTPNLDRLASKGVTGMSTPIAPGVSPGSGVAHIALFGYNPFTYDVGRGAIAAYGVGLDMEEDDIAVRINFAGFNSAGAVVDRRAGRLPTEKNVELCRLLRQIKMNEVEIIIETVQDYRSVVIFRGEGLHPDLSDSDPQATGEGVFPHRIVATKPRSKYSASVANTFIREANEIMRKEARDIVEMPNGQHLGILTRGYSNRPQLPIMQQLYGLENAGVIASYPDYRGIARIVGMDVLYTGHDLEGEFDRLEEVFHNYDFIFFHVKGTDSAGEDGNFDEKVRLLEELDKLMPRVEELSPDVMAITADHSTPATYKGHSWHPVPFALVSKWCRPDGVKVFCESECRHGSLGLFQATEVMLYALGSAGRIDIFRA
ncbi:MAG: 2,3-bisphosphoglycerate-independent phosphoglycerate mutase [Candidatus Poribacteria bacterium]|nr:2,3-bisphosphoglycerate-independent phosphoglycerate mutase [Candidatus Poribacteria bacterium]MDQ1328182.1 2,3-bisphosphoglycerate-independent phosphoglycerate mutase [Candidatus Poribacteria bacterium]